MSYSNITLITDPNLSFEQYDFIQIVHDENNYIIGRVVSYNKTTGELIFTPIKFEGSGSFSTWRISLTGDPGSSGGGTGSPGTSGTSGESGISGTSGTSASFENFEILDYINNKGPDRIIRVSPDEAVLQASAQLTFDGRTLTIAPDFYSTGENPIYRIVYHDDGTAGTAGIVVRGPVIGQPYDGIIENRVPENYQHQFVVGGNNVVHIDDIGLHTQQPLIADDDVYFQYLEQDNSSNKFLVWNSGTSGDGLAGRVGWTTSGASGDSGSSGSSGLSGTSGTSGAAGSSFKFLGGWSQNGGVSDVPYGLNDIVVWPLSGPNMIVYIYTSEDTAPIGSAAPNLDPNWKVMVMGGNDGTAGTSGESGASGSSGTSGQTGVSGTSGTSGKTLKLSANDFEYNNLNPDGSRCYYSPSSYDFTTGMQVIARNAVYSMTGNVQSYSGGLLCILPEPGSSVVGGTNVSITLSGYPGISGTSGTSGTGASGTSGTSGQTGASGTSGTSGTSFTGNQNYVQVLGSQVNSVTSSGTTIISGSITTNGGPVSITVTGDANPVGGTSYVRLQLYRNGSAIGNIVQAENGSNLNVPYCLTFIDEQPAGTYTYAMKTGTMSGTFQFGEANGPTLTMVELIGSGTSGTTGTSGTSGASAAASYMRGSRSAQQTTNLTTNSLVAFTQSDNSASSDISLNTSTGQITLAAGKTYRLMAQVPNYTASSNTARPAFCWYNETASAWIGSQSSAYSASDSPTYGAFGGLSEAVITVASTTVVSFRILGVQAGLTGLGGSADFNTTGSYPWFDVEVISGYSPVANGTSGTSGTGAAGTSGTSGTGASGTSGSSGTSGTRGSSGTSGTAGTSGSTGTSGSSGTSGQSGGYLNMTSLLDNIAATSRSGSTIVTEWTTSYTSVAGSTVLFNLSFSAYVPSSIGLKQFDLVIDGSTAASISYYFNSANVHFTIPCSFSVENLSEGSHTIQIRIPAGVTVDSQDYAHLSVIETMGNNNGTSGTSGSAGTSGTSNGVIPAWTSVGAITFGATTTAPTKGTITKDNISYRQLGAKEWEIVMTYYQTANTGAANGSGDYLFTLPNSLSFDMTLPSQTQYQANIGTSSWYNATYVIPSGCGMISNGGTGGKIFPVVYNSTQFRVLAINDSAWVNWFGSGHFQLASNSYVTMQLTFRFTSA